MKIDEVINGQYLPLNNVIKKNHLVELAFPGDSIFIEINPESGTYSMTKKFTGIRTSETKKELYDLRSVIHFDRKLEDVTEIRRPGRYDYGMENRSLVTLRHRDLEITEIDLKDSDITLDHLLYGLMWLPEQ